MLKHTLLFVITFIVCLTLTCTASPIKRRHSDVCKRMDVGKALELQRKQNPLNPCTGEQVANHDRSRVPPVIPEIVCPVGTGDQCIQIQLPMNVSFPPDVPGGKTSQHIILVPSGCIENVSFSSSTKTRHNKFKHDKVKVLRPKKL